MVSFGSSRERYLLTAGIVRLKDERYDALIEAGQVLQLQVTNLRNRPLSIPSLESMMKFILSLHHNLTTGSKDFPPIEFLGVLRSKQVNTPFVHVEQRENKQSSLMEGPSGLLVPIVRSRFPILTPVHPEQAELEVLTADRRNCVQHVEVDGRTVSRVISLVYRSETTELTNYWRVSDYRRDGLMLMSVLCCFTSESEQDPKILKKMRKMKYAEEDTTKSPPKTCLRV